jgi:hypothetical protein
MATSPYYYYLDILSQWPTSIALESQWFLWFDLPSVTALKGDISKALNKFEFNSNWNITSAATQDLLSTEFQRQTQNLIGCVFARQITIPGETVSASNEGLDYGGYQAPATSSGRNKYGKVSVTFTETNSSFIDLVIRPWVALVGYNGLIARDPASPKYVKCNSLNVHYIGKTGAFNPSVTRKMITFQNIAPISVGGLTNTYASEGMQYSSVDFVYDNYSVTDFNVANQ